MNKIYVLVPIYNFSPFLEKCLQSILLQSYREWYCILFDDGSIDISGKICKNYVSRYPNKFKYVKLSNKNNGPAYSKFYGIQAVKELCDRSDIFIIVDGDDFLVTPFAFSIIINKYKETKCWATFGSYRGKFSENQKNIKMNIYNRKTWFYSPPRSCKCFLLNLFTENDFKYKDNTWLRKATDAAFFCNIIEWSGIENVQYIPNILYQYRDHRNNVYKKTTKLLKNHVDYIRSRQEKEKFTPVDI